jgi:exopolysaccharide biosynthesis polyprenyl glycosylphosphotransferase
MGSSAPALESIPLSKAERGDAFRRWNVHVWEWKALIVILIVTDLLMVGLAFRVAYWIRFETGLTIFAEALSSNSYYERLVLVLTPVWLLIFVVVGLYQRDVLLGGTEEYSRVFRGTSIGLLFIVMAGFLDPQLIIARGWVLMAWGLTFLLISLGRLVIRRIAYWLRSHGFFLARALIVGANAEASALAEQLLRWRTSGLELVGFVDGEQDPGMKLPQNLRVVGALGDLDRLIVEHGVEELILASSALSRESMLTIFRRYGVSEGIRLRMSSGLYEIITTGLSVRELAYVPLVGVNRVRLTGVDWVIKAALDYALAVPAVVILSPLLAALALLVRIDSPGPIIHRRRVMGVNGRQFDAFKFRTMREDGDEILAQRPDLRAELAQTHKLRDDPRVTRVGLFLRRYSLDELPQLFNVLRREMSLVGPRMISPAEMARYEQWGINLLTVHPGITGLWQVSGRSEIGYEERVRLDMHYIRNWNIWLDLQLLWQTVPAVLKARGAY